jgi:hypothetical protein
MLDLLFRPLRSALGLAEQELERPIVDAEHEMLDTVAAIHRVAESIERHIEVIEGLATSIDPLKQSVNNLTATMGELVELLEPMGKAEVGVAHASQEVRHFLGFRRHKNAAPPAAAPRAPGDETAPASSDPPATEAAPAGASAAPTEAAPAGDAQS